MHVEHERKFTVDGDSWRGAADQPVSIWQGWLVAVDGCETRVRIADGLSASITTKIDLGETGRRLEIEAEVDVETAGMLRQRCSAWLEKTRWIVEVDGRAWEVDEYHGDLAGLVVCELENPDGLESLPAWVGREVTGESGWSNAELARRVRRRT